MLKRLTAFTVIFSSLLTAVQPAIATPTPTIKANCTWIEHGKKPIQQPCTVSGNSGITTYVYAIDWQDGVHTTIWCKNRGGCTSKGDRKAEIFNEVELHKMLFPQAIVLKNLGKITIDYEKKPK
jgi:hypothetical protein